jgi:hypothetical protein
MVSSKQFTWSGGVGSAEISDFGPSFSFIRAFPDSCDEGLDVVSERTGAVERFVVVETVYGTEDDDRSILSWKLEPVRRALKGKTSLVIFND